MTITGTLGMLVANRPDQVQAVHSLHLEIGQDNRGGMIRETRKRLGSVFGVDCVTPRVLLDQAASSQAVNRVIVHNQNFRNETDSPRG